MFFPSDLLRSNIILVDTPGIGSIYAHNTKAARRCHSRSDIGVFIVSSDQPFTEAEK